jgi:hypothetical protein
MRLVCIFKGNTLLDQSDFFHPLNAQQFKENVAFQTGFDVNDLDAVLFEDEEMTAYAKPNKHMPRKKLKINKEEVQLINLVDSSIPSTGTLDWKNCSQDQIEQHFSPEDQQKIAENKAYYQALGKEKYSVGYSVQWLHEVSGPTVDMETNEVSEVVYKTIQGVVL